MRPFRGVEFVGVAAAAQLRATGANLAAIDDRLAKVVARLSARDEG
ncbi:MAG: hypothetical protein ACRDRI_01845 [Pseudonocardiaceae bacterium]